jgi:hypothetical protein
MKLDDQLLRELTNEREWPNGFSAAPVTYAIKAQVPLTELAAKVLENDRVRIEERKWRGGNKP